MKRRNDKMKNGFTLVELIAAIIVIGLIIGAAISEAVLAALDGKVTTPNEAEDPVLTVDKWIRLFVVFVLLLMTIYIYRKFFKKKMEHAQHHNSGNYKTDYPRSQHSLHL